MNLPWRRRVFAALLAAATTGAAHAGGLPSFAEVKAAHRLSDVTLLDRHGVSVKRIISAHDWNSEANRSLIRRLLEEPGA